MNVRAEARTLQNSCCAPRVCEDPDALAMEFNEIVEGACVVAVVLGAVVESCTVWAEGSGDEDALVRKCGCGVASKRDEAPT